MTEKTKSKPAENLKAEKTGFFNGKNRIIAVIIGVAIIAAVVLIFAFQKSPSDDSKNNANKTGVDQVSSNRNSQAENINVSQGNQNTNASTENKVLGKSSGKIPYAEIDEEHIASDVVDSNGSVIQATLPNNVIAYLIIPIDEVIQAAAVSLIPYKSMPSGANHGYLSDDYGYGVQVQIESLEMGLGGYLVFDTTGGKATEVAAAKADYFNRCDPNFVWFDPYLCAKKNNVSVSTVVTKNATVITPIHRENFNDLTFAQNTIPLGIDGLLVTRIEGGDVFIPQKLDQDLAKELVQDTLSDNSSNTQKLESLGMAMAWQIKDFSQEQIEMASKLNDGEKYQETVKALAVSKAFSEYLDRNDINLTRGDFEDTSLDELIADINENLDYILDIVLEDAQDLTESFGFELDSVEAAAAIYDAASLGLSGADSALSTLKSNIEITVQDDDASVATRTSALESSGYANSGSASGSGEPTPTIEMLQGVAIDVFNHVMADPNATIWEILNALQLIRETGVEPWENYWNQGIEKITEILRKMMEDATWAKDFLDIAEIACALGIDDICEEALEKAKTAPISQRICDLVKKNLLNYGINNCPTE